MVATFIDAGDHVVARWRLKARASDGDETLDLSMVGVYEFERRKTRGGADVLLGHGGGAAVSRERGAAASVGP